VVRLDRVLDRERLDSVASWPWLSRLEMLPVTTLVLLEMDTEDAEAVEAGDWDPAETLFLDCSMKAVLMSMMTD